MTVFAERPLYLTATRRRITALLEQEQRYLTAAAVMTKLKASIPTLAKSTVYRTLERLESSGFVTSRTEADGETSYVWCHSAHHHHAICRTCGRVTDVDCEAIDALKQRLLDEAGFVVDGHAIELLGYCAQCREKREPGSRK
ncbi:MAG TPA: Fur family transcriptional regulator [Candidatus Sulfotelmatobacter sp.]|nr:Fur family transcriptional regulator [Candidatus Sulfotelmatobacter sp.]